MSRESIHRRQLLHWAAGLAAAGFCPGLSLASPQDREPALPASEIAPAKPFRPGWFRLMDGQGHEMDLNGLASAGALINLWATWCGPCIEEMPGLIALAGETSIYGINFLPIACDSGGADAVRAFYAKQGLKGLPILTCPDNSAFKAFHARVLPHTAVVNTAGMVVASVSGAIDWKAVSPLSIRRLTR